MLANLVMRHNCSVGRLRIGALYGQLADGRRLRRRIPSERTAPLAFRGGLRQARLGDRFPAHPSHSGTDRAEVNIGAFPDKCSSC